MLEDRAGHCIWRPEGGFCGERQAGSIGRCQILRNRVGDNWHLVGLGRMWKRRDWWTAFKDVENKVPYRTSWEAVREGTHSKRAGLENRLGGLSAEAEVEVRACGKRTDRGVILP